MRSRWAVTLAVVVACVVSGCESEPERAEEPVPVLGWIVGDGCASTPEAIRADADGLVARGAVAAGYRSLYVVCDDTTAPAVVDDPTVRDHLADRGLRLEAVPSNDADVNVAMRADVPLPALRTAITRHVMNAQPLVFDGDATLLDDAQIATVTNRGVLDIGRDDRRTAGAPIRGDGERLSRAVGSQGLIVSLTNDESTPRDLAFELDEVNLAGADTVAATDVWTGRRVQASDGVITVPVASTDSVLLRIG